MLGWSLRIYDDDGAAEKHRGNRGYRRHDGRYRPSWPCGRTHPGARRAGAERSRARFDGRRGPRPEDQEILAANADDLFDARAAGLTGAVLDRLALDDKRVDGMAVAIEAVRALKDPVGHVTESWTG